MHHTHSLLLDATGDDLHRLGVEGDGARREDELPSVREPISRTVEVGSVESNVPIGSEALTPLCLTA